MVFWETSVVSACACLNASLITSRLVLPFALELRCCPHDRGLDDLTVMMFGITRAHHIPKCV